MSGRRDVVVAEPMLPGLMPDKPIADLLATFEIDVDQSYRIIANKLPTAVQREMLQKRGAELNRVLAPASASAQAQVELIQILALWLGGYPVLAHADNAGMAKSYADHLKALPLFAVRKAIASIKDRTAKKIGKFGREETLDPDTVPSSSRVFDLAKKEMRAADAEQWKIDRLLSAKATKDGNEEVSEEQRKRVGALMAGLASDMKRGAIFAPKLRQEQEEEEDRQRREREQRAAASNSARDRSILAEYERLGLEPVYAAPGVLVSPGLAKTKRKKRRG